MAQGVKSSGTCEDEGCDRDAKTNGRCKTHAEKARRAALPFKACSHGECGKDSRYGSQGMCGMHYRRTGRNGTPEDSGLTRRPPGVDGTQTCRVEKCERIEHHGWGGHCSMHGARLRRHGDPTMVKQGVKMHIEQAEPGPECDPWPGRLDARGYGPHRSVWDMKRGPRPAGMQVDHKCRVTSCINVDHLELVTPRENARRRDVAYLYIKENGDPGPRFWLKFWEDEAR